MTLGAASTQEIEKFDKESENEEETTTDKRGQILWIRGLNRLQHQVTTATYCNNNTVELIALQIAHVATSRCFISRYAW